MMLELNIISLFFANIYITYSYIFRQCINAHLLLPAAMQYHNTPLVLYESIYVCIHLASLQSGNARNCSINCISDDK